MADCIPPWRGADRHRLVANSRRPRRLGLLLREAGLRRVHGGLSRPRTIGIRSRHRWPAHDPHSPAARENLDGLDGTLRLAAGKEIYAVAKRRPEQWQDGGS